MLIASCLLLHVLLSEISTLDFSESNNNNDNFIADYSKDADIDAKTKQKKKKRKLKNVFFSSSFALFFSTMSASLE